jgi:hypothetical protein
MLSISILTAWETLSRNGCGEGRSGQIFGGCGEQILFTLVDFESIGASEHCQIHAAARLSVLL